MGGACSTHETNEKFILNFNSAIWRKEETRYNWRQVWEIITDLQKTGGLDVKWTYLVHYSPVEGCYEKGNKSSTSIKPPVFQSIGKSVDWWVDVY
jgi:hypothetical protein